MRLAICSIMVLLLAAAPSMALTTSECFDCHSDDTLTKTVGGRELSLYIDEKVFGASIHGDLDCTDCHADLADMDGDHPEEVQAVECSNCHDGEEELMGVSAHSSGQAKLAQDLPRCFDCHGKHDILPSSDSRSRTYDLRVPGTCCACHGSADVASRHPSLTSEVCREYEEGMHGVTLIRSGMIFSAVCNDCHGSHDVLPSENPKARTNRANINRTCSNCHAGVVQTYEASVHGRLFASGSQEAPTCISCHGTHLVERALDDTFLLTVTNRCGACHQEESQTFRKNYHGQTTGMGYTKAAQCPDCHGAHNIMPREDPTSTIHPDNLVGTCSKCHPGAGISFTQYMPHADYHDQEKYPLLYFVYLAMVVLLFGVFIFFGIHTLLWFIRAQKEVHGKRS